MVTKNRRTRKALSQEEKLRRIFLRRTAASYHSHKRRGKAGQRLDYRLSELRTIVQEAFSGRCPYCRCELTARNFSVDHAVPTSRT
jgi:hypothetical protein